MKKRAFTLVCVSLLLCGCAAFREAVCGVHPHGEGPTRIEAKHGAKDGIKDILGAVGSLVGPVGSIASTVLGYGLDFFCNWTVEKPSEVLDAAGEWLGLTE